MTTAPVPWQYTDQASTVQWTWLTEHLVARIWADAIELDGERHVRSYAWEVCDRMTVGDGLPRLLVEGQASTFVEAERCVREHVGKAFDPRLGYRDYAGTEATTFTLASGERRDLGPLLGSRCHVTVILEGGERAVVSGDLSVRNYSIVLREGDRTRVLVPEHIASVSHRSAAAERAAGLVVDRRHAGFGRIYRAEWSPGCTGMPGFEVGTVDHGSAGPCPLHERQGLPA